MTTLYKLTSANLTTFRGCLWIPGEWKSAPGKGELCTSGWIHAYESPLVGIFMDLIHGNFGSTGRMWECEGEGMVLRDHDLKIGVERLRLISELPLPVIDTERRVTIAILCAKRVCVEPSWIKWADDWLSGRNRTANAAAAWATAAWAIWATDAAAAAARAAADAADVVANVAAAAQAAANAAAAAAAMVGGDSFLTEIINQAIKGE